MYSTWATYSVIACPFTVRPGWLVTLANESLCKSPGSESSSTVRISATKVEVRSVSGSFNHVVALIVG